MKHKRFFIIFLVIILSLFLILFIDSATYLEGNNETAYSNSAQGDSYDLTITFYANETGYLKAIFLYMGGGTENSAYSFDINQSDVNLVHEVEVLGIANTYRYVNFTYSGNYSNNPINGSAEFTLDIHRMSGDSVISRGTSSYSGTYFSWTGQTQIPHKYSGVTFTYTQLIESSNINITLNSPEDDYATTDNEINFNASYEGANNVSNSTLYVWYSNDTLHKTNFTDLSSPQTNSTSVVSKITGFLLGYSYKWNYYFCDITGICDWATGNYTLTRGSKITTFNNSLTSENVSVNSTRFLRIPKSANVTGAYMNLSGYAIGEGDYTGENFSLSASGGSHLWGLTQNGTFFWIGDWGTDRVYKYFMNGTYTQDSFDISGSGNGFVSGITNNNTFIWTTDYVSNKVYKYFMNGTYTQDSFDVDITGSEALTGLTQNGTFFWINDEGYSRVYKYFMNGTYTQDSFIQTVPYGGITQNGTFFWIGIYNNYVYKRYINGTLIKGISVNVTGTIFYPRGITQNGTFFWIGDSNSNKIYKYYFSDQYPTNPTITLNKTQIWNYSGTFNQANNKTDNFNGTIQGVLDGQCTCTGCSIDGFYCNIPLDFNSDTSGKLEYSDINILYYTSGFVLDLLTPSNNSWTTASQNFSCSQSDSALGFINSTLHIWNSTGDVYYQNTTDITGESNYTSWDVSFTYGDNMTWNCLVFDSTSQQWSPTNYTFETDPIIPSVSIDSITTTQGSQTISYNSSASDTYLNSCKYSIYNSVGAVDGLNNNVSISCNSNPHSATVTAYGTYTLTIYANDLAGNENQDSLNFTTSPSSGTTVIGGGGSTTLEGRTEAKNYSITSINYLNNLDISLAKDSVKPRSKPFYITNKGSKEITLELVCDETNTTSTRDVSICDYVEFNQTVTVSPNENDPYLGYVKVLTPPNSQIGDEYYFNIFALKEEGTEEYSKLSVSTRVSSLASVYKWSYINKEKNKSYPVALVSSVLAIILSAIVGKLTFKNKKYVFGFVMSILTFFAVFILGIIIL